MARGRRTQREPAHKLPDIAGISLVALSLILLVALGMQNAGLLGDGIAAVFRMLFGQAAWVVPIVLFVAGIALIFGHSKFQAGRVTWGAALIFVGGLAGLARAEAGDYFTDSAMQASGGYLGAIFGWVLHGLLGVASPIAVGAFILVGAALCFDDPVRDVLARFKPKSLPKIKTLEAKAVSAKSEADERRQAAVKMLQASLDDEQHESDAETEAPKPKERRPVSFTRQAPQEITLDTTSNEPRDGYILPPLDLLTPSAVRKKRDPKEVQRNIDILEDTLDQFNIEANVVEVATGPTITRYEIQLGAGIRVNKITNLADNIALSLAASHVRVEAPIPGKSAIGIEIPNSVRQTINLREMCDSLEFHDQTHKLTVALGKDVSGEPKYTDLTRMPHLLVGGATNSGKSICLATLIMSLILRLTPKDLRLVMIDPKRVELTLFENLPHLMCPVVKDVKEASGVLRAVVREMDRRYDKFSDAQVRNIDGWNAKANFQDKMPYVVVIIDELADLMIQCRNEVETSICRLAQLARATGIHLVIATQRPSVDVITGTIKNNISSRVAFAVSSGVDSRTILDQVGAEDLVGRGDMLFMPIDATKPLRLQGCYVTEKEIEDVCTFWRKQEKPQYVLNPVEIAVQEREADMRDAEDPVWQDAVQFVVERQQASTSMLQRKFGLGFQRASRLLDMMEERGIVGPKDGAKPREILVDPMQLQGLLGRAEYESPMPEGSFLED